MKLMVVESPNKVKKIESFLGAGWRVVASVGHIRDLPPRQLGIEPPDFRLQYEFIPPVKNGERTFPGGKERVDKIRALVKQADMVYLATDPDREGEAIAWHLKESLGLGENDYVRIAFDEITEQAVKKAIQCGRKIDHALVRAQEGRRALDRIVGYKVSPLLSDMLAERLSAGRVQSVAVRLVVDQERAIQAFRKTDHFGAAVSFDGGAWKAEWDTSPFVTDEAPYVLDRALAQSAADCRQFRVLESSTKEVRRAPPSPFSTSLMLQAASVTLKLDPEVTTRAAQRLFEQGLITYIRTDGVNISDEAAVEIRGYATAQGWKVPDAPRTYKAKGGAQEAHEAIRPTHIEQHEAGQDETERQLYRLIWQRTVASQLADARYSVNQVLLEATDGPQPFRFRAKGQTLIDPGWRVLTGKDAIEEQEAEEDQSGRVPALEQGATMPADGGDLLLKATKAPSRFTKASLIARLEKEGIGRPATYAAIMANIMQRGYLEEQKRFLVPTAVGCTIVDHLVKGCFGFIALDFTREMEAQLDQVAEGQLDYLDVVAPAYELLEAEIQAVRESGQFKPRHACPKCSAALRRFQRKDKATGKPIRGAYGWACTNGDCKTFLDDDKGNPVEVKQAPCPDCGKPMYRRKGANGFWWACSGYPDCNTTRPDANGKPGEARANNLREDVRCPVCDKPTRYLSGKSAKTKKAYSFFSCSDRECKGTVPADKHGNPQLAK